MLPTATDNGGRLAAILPTGLAALAPAMGHSIDAVLRDATHARRGCTDDEGETQQPPSRHRSLEPQIDALAGTWAEEAAAHIPALRALVVVAVDGLGSANLKARRGHAPSLAGLPQRRISTVTPSTTAAALTTLTTGQLPAQHGLVGYRILHPQLGLISPLRDWEGIERPREWQKSEPLFHLASRMGVASRTYGRPAHADSGLSRAILSGATYVGGDTIESRLQAAKRDIASRSVSLAYVYIDELDRAGHQHGWQSDAWGHRLEQLDTALGDFLTGLPADTGVIVTADHGMVDVAPHQHVVFDLDAPEFAAVREIGGEPRFRSFYLHDSADSAGFATELRAREGKRAWVVTREEAVASGVFGPRPAPEVVARLGDVLLAARAQCAYYSTGDEPRALHMIGQHGSWTDEERGVPLILGGALAGSGFARAVELVAQGRD